MGKKISKALFITLVVMMLLSVVGLSTAFAEGTYREGYYTYTVENGEVTITNVYSSISGDVTIPSELGGYPVTSIGNYAFDNCTSLTSVTIGDSVTSIGDKAFYDCSSLTSITIPDLVTSIGIYAFDGTAYYNNTEKWNNGVLCIGNHIIKANSDLSGSYTIKKGTKTIADSAFFGCEILTSITIPDSVTSIGDKAFYDCSSLTSITIPDSVTSIGDKAFYDCSSLTSITIPELVTSIGEYAFYNCSSLTSITIPDSVTRIGIYAFDGTAYYNNTGNWHNCVLYIGNHLIKANSNWTPDFYYYTIKEGTKTIAGSAFYGCYELTRVTIPNSVTSIGDSAFEDCNSLTSITIPDSVTSIGDSAFWCCGSLTSITIPDSVTSIGENAFYNCSSLTSITIPDSVTSISSGTFEACSSLTSIIIPDSVTSISSGAFMDCSNLASITIPDSVTSIGGSAFCYCDSLESITIPDSVTSIGGYAFDGTAYYNNAENWNNSVLYIGNHLIKANSNFPRSYTIKKGTKTIANFAFEDCFKLTDITIPDSVTSIGAGAFEDCTSLTSITIPDLVTSIGNYVFDNCTSLTSVTIGDSLTSIGYSAFDDCDSLASITIGDSLTSIGDSAFKYCYDLKNVYYTGTPEQWTDMVIGGENSYLTNATIHYNYCDHKYTFVLSQTSYTYNGYVKAPTVIVKDKAGNVLKKGTDYTISYAEGRKNVGTYKVTVTMIGVHNGIKELFFDITTADISTCAAKLSETSLIYNGSVRTPAVIVTNANGAKLTTDTHYTVSYSAGRKDPGTYNVIVTMKGNYTGTKTLSFTIKPIDISSCAVKLSATSYAYDGKVKTPTVTVTNSYGTRLSKDKHYTVTYASGRKNAGTHNVTVTMIGNYTGTKTLSFKINPVNVSKCDMALSNTSYTYDGTTKIPNVIVLNHNGTKLTESSYTVTYDSGRKNVGTYNVTVTMKGNYTGTKTLSFKINPMDISKCNVKLSATSVTYNAKVRTPTVTVTNPNGAKLTKDTHYTVTYSSGRRNVGTYNVTVTMKGNYTGTKTLSFKIKPMDISDCTVKLSATSVIYNAKVRTPDVTVVNSNGAKLTKDTHYTVTYDSGRRNVGTYNVTVKLKGNYTGTKTLSFKINPMDISKCNVKLSATSVTYNAKVRTPAVTVTNPNGAKLTKDTHYTVTYSSGRRNVGTYNVTVKLKGNYTGTKTLSFKITPMDISKCTVKLSATSVTYNGEVRTPTVSIVNPNGAKLTKDTHYTVTYSSGRKNVGTYKITVKLKGNYTGTKTLSFKILPPKTTISKLTAGAKKITVNLTKKTTQVTGYQIQYATNKNFTNAKTKTLTSNSTVKTTLTGLTANKTYYVRVRTYKTVNDVKYYSCWSAYKYVKTK